MGAAFDRVVKRLEAADCRPRVYGSGKAIAHCPGPGHWRGDQHPSLAITPADGSVLVHCHAGCNAEDVLGALDLTMADLFDEPRQPKPDAPATRRLRTAIGRTRGLSVADRYVYLWLLGLADWGNAVIPHTFQPRGQRQLAGDCGLDLVNLQHAIAHLTHHKWLTLACAAKDCTLPWPHRGRGHRAEYAFPGIGTDCPGEACRAGCRPGKTAQRSHLRLVTGTSVIAAVTLLTASGGAARPPTTYLLHKPAADLRLSAPQAVFSRLLSAVFYGAKS